MTDRESRERLIELICDQIQDGHCVGYCNHPPCSQCEHLADHLLANGIIVLPCKVGDKVYIVKSRTSDDKNLYIVLTMTTQLRKEDEGKCQK